MKKIHFNTLAPLMLAATSLNLLVGCTAYDENFDCPAGKGLGCQSVTEVKKKLNQGAIDMPETTTEAAARLGGAGLGGASLRGSSFMAPVVSTGNGVASDQHADDPVVFIDSHGMKIERAREQPLRVWIAPYQDRDGNFHESSVVHTVVTPGYWQIQPNTTAS